MSARGSKREVPDSTGEEIHPRAEPGATITNRAALDMWVETLDPSPRMAVLIRLAQSLADEMDSADWTAPVAREHRIAIQELAELIAGEGEDDGQAGVLVALRTAVRDSEVA